MQISTRFSGENHLIIRWRFGVIFTWFLPDYQLIISWAFSVGKAEKTDVQSRSLSLKLARHEVTSQRICYCILSTASLTHIHWIISSHRNHSHRLPHKCSRIRKNLQNFWLLIKNKNKNRNESTHFLSHFSWLLS